MIKDEPAIPLWRHPVLVAAVAGTLLLFSLGLIAGVVASSIEREAMKPLGAAFLVGALVVVVASTWLLKRSIPAIFTQVSPRVGRARKMLVWSMVIGALLGMFLVLGSLAVGTEPPEVFSNAPIPQWLAIVAIAIILVVVPPITWAWHRSIDEHESEAYRDGTLAGIYVFSAVAPGWWLAWRGGMLPEPDVMIVFLIVYVVWGLVWVVRRYG